MNESAGEGRFPPDDQVRSRFARVAENYDTAYFLSDPARLAEAVMLCKPRPSDLALDVATGTGHTALALAGYVRSVVGLDLTEQMLSFAQQRAIERAVDNAAWLLGDACLLPFLGASFDLYTIRAAAHHFYDLEASLREAVRVLKPGGRACFIDISPPLEVREFLHDIEVELDPSHIRCLTIEEWTEVLTKVGFEVEFFERRQEEWDFAGWMETQSIPAAKAEELAERIESAPVAVREVLAPRRQAGRLYHSYWHAMIRARKAR
ncbi:MAG: class I SAM-dependent methyltransferase [Candidatus Dormibacteraceae bacterium]